MTYSPIVELSLYISAVFSPEFMILFAGFLLAVAASLMLLRKHSISKAFSREVSAKINSCLLIVGSTAIGTILSQIFKFAFQIPRPVEMIIQETGYSFPSGHATVGTAFLAAIIASIYVFHANTPMPLRRLIVSICVILIIGVCASRLILKVHMPIDVIVGVILGLLSTIMMVGLIRKISKVSGQ